MRRLRPHLEHMQRRERAQERELLFENVGAQAQGAFGMHGQED